MLFSLMFPTASPLFCGFILHTPPSLLLQRIIFVYANQRRRLPALCISRCLSRVKALMSIDHELLVCSSTSDFLFDRCGRYRGFRTSYKSSPYLRLCNGDVGTHGSLPVERESKWFKQCHHSSCFSRFESSQYPAYNYLR